MLLYMSAIRTEGLASVVTEYQLQLIFDNYTVLDIGNPTYDYDECVKLGKEIVENFAKRFVYVEFKYREG